MGALGCYSGACQCLGLYPAMKWHISTYGIYTYNMSVIATGPPLTSPLG